MKRYFTLTIFFWALLVGFAHAATMTLSAPATTAVGEQFTVDVLADTDKTAINSVEASIAYPSDKLDFVGYQENAGVIRFWITQPKAVGGIVTFAGGIPGGASTSVGTDTQTLTLARLLFIAKATGAMPLSISRSTLLKNDGKGTTLSHTTAGTTVTVSGDAPKTQYADTTPPQPFDITYLPQDRATDTPALIAFHTTDRESGIKTYRVKVWWGSWHDATSPYSVQACLVGCTVQVQAIDVAGNVQIAHIAVPGIVPWWSLAVLFVVVGTGLWRYFMVQRKI